MSDTKVERIPYKTKYLELEKQYNDLAEELKNKDELIAELQAECNIVNPKPHAEVKNIDYKQQRDVLVDFYRLMSKYIIHHKETDLYTMDVAFNGPKGKQTILKAKKLVDNLED